MQVAEALLQVGANTLELQWPVEGWAQQYLAQHHPDLGQTDRYHLTSEV